MVSPKDDVRSWLAKVDSNVYYSTTLGSKLPGHVGSFPAVRRTACARLVQRLWLHPLASRRLFFFVEMDGPGEF